MIKPYISYSEFWLYTNDPNRYYLQYVLGVKDPANEPMIFGSVVHDAIDDRCDLETELNKKFFTANWIRVGKELVKKARKMPVQELAVYIRGNKDNQLKCPILAIFDGLDFDKNILLERKTTKNGWRTQEQVDEADQLILYAFAYREMRRIIPNVELERLSSTNGKVKYFETVVTEAKIRDLIDRVNKMYDDLNAKGWWDRRRVRENNQIDEAISNFEKYAI